MAFAAKSAGYAGVSLGGMLIGLNRDGVFQLYRWYGNGAGKGFTDCVTTSSFYIDADKLPPDLGGMTVRFKVEDGVVVYGTTQVTLEVYSPNQSLPVYSTTRRPKVSGTIMGGLESLGPLKRLRKTDWNIHLEGPAWQLELLRISQQLGFYHPSNKKVIFGEIVKGLTGGLASVTLDVADVTMF